MFNFFHDIAQKGAVLLTASIAASLGFITQPNVVVINPPPPILVLPAPTSTEPIQQTSTVAIATTTTITNNTPASTTIPRLLKKEERPKQFAPAKPLNARMILDKTTFSLSQRMDGAYVLTFYTATADNSGFYWNLSQTDIGGTGIIPKLNISFSCDPEPHIPSPNLPDQSPTFDLNTSYSCVISLTGPISGTENKQISFQTGAGRLVAKASDLYTILKSDDDTGGFIFDNQSAEPITITGLTFDVSFTALATSTPLVLRFLDPITELPLADYHLENSPVDPSRPYTNTNLGMKTPLSFAINSGNQRLLPVKVLGVKQLNLGDINPEIKITLQEVDTDRSDIKTTFFSPLISWSCIPYDPYHAQSLPTEQNCK